MSIKLITPKYNIDGPESITLKKLNFKKGKFIIDFYKYVKKINTKNLGYFEIVNFPEDCETYKIEEELKK